MPAKKKPKLYRAISTGVVKVNGRRVTYHRGITQVPPGHPLLKAAPTKFRPVDLGDE
jgi:hypothetical protein